jgi:hypothetical protein
MVTGRSAWVQRSRHQGLYRLHISPIKFVSTELFPLSDLFFSLSSFGNLVLYLLFLISDLVLVSCDIMSSRKYPSGSEKRKRKNRTDDFIETQKGALDKLFDKSK